ncbi:sphingosine-1-phosphate phosphatase [Schizosaccharomyces japonicus yFS275]|uniref:Sphingosine-1-phosphate phosphatase n=1 Tax=Schizosaccharomyces japonicus (strain yFS275 / FY16936) TaxID=402676 RepID=B6K8A9_SCHJY|nr:sphingosine-1-phosphate phosphatase [Schizosaccharomyces japonicus yFS275]EEB09763.1 sphingosine-1-phosphate phosphatase [Schizosaccharomyces japonicus yFS275]
MTTVSKEKHGSVRKEHASAHLGNLKAEYYRSKFNDVMRFRIRTILYPIIRGETPLISSLQKRFRKPSLDTYFALSAFFGTHFFFLISLPISFWSGHLSFTIAMVQLFASGCYITGFIKDYCCLPRPRSPPVKRISYTKGANFEYGFPSTHTMNAVSTATYSLFTVLHYSRDVPLWQTFTLISVIFLYAFSIMIGRLYCGMHGFLDISSGCVMGVILAYFRWTYRSFFDDLFFSPSILVPLISFVLCIFLIWALPDAVENCICIEDSISFVAVILGISIGSWASTAKTYNYLKMPASQSLIVLITRICIGVPVVGLWKELGKFILLKVLIRVFHFLGKEDLEPIRISQRGIKTAADSVFNQQNTTGLGVSTAHRDHPHPIRFDHETVARIIIYAGIGYLATHPLPLLFKWLKV